MNKKLSILLAFFLLSIYHIPNVNQWLYAQNLFAFGSNNFSPVVKKKPANDKKVRIQLALLLDTSNSMDGLIGQAKSQLWKMVNELAETKKDGQTPLIEIALYEYGNDDLSARKGYVEQVVPLSDDLDMISEKLFQLNTRGGEEYCGYVMRTALDELTWSDNPDNLKIIFIAGNEAFNQGPVAYKTIAQRAKERGILVNTIFCGNYQEGVETFWQEGAQLANGQYMVINHNDVVEHIETPFDGQINQLNKDLNATYLGYGTQGASKQQRQVQEDSNASTYGLANARQRASFKAKKAYKSSTWDVVDATEEDESFLENETEQLPDVLQKMTVKERKVHVKALKDKRASIQKQILELDQKAKTHIAKVQKEKANKSTLDNAMIETLRKQAQKKSFEF